MYGRGRSGDWWANPALSELSTFMEKLHPKDYLFSCWKQENKLRVNISLLEILCSLKIIHFEFFFFSKQNALCNNVDIFLSVEPQNSGILSLQLKPS